VLVGGDALSPERLRLWHELTGGRTKLLYAYGLTEATITTLLNVDPRPAGGDEAPAAIPIGRPIANTHVYILDGNRQPLPAGARGELFVGGVGLARGYRSRPELTAERFVPHPFDPSPGARLYRTGDLARFRGDGDVEFLGRIDQQVKIRGFRIELGEIETVLAQHPQVREAAVMAREDTPGQKRLVAYVVPAPGEPPTTSELRGFLKSRLPEHLVPAAFSMLETLPLTATGKLDRRALPAPDTARPALDRAYAPPQTEAERQLAQIWSGLLGIERVGIHDNFFELGGDSILSIQVVSRANAAGLRITPKQLFQHQSIAELAEVAGAAPRIHAEQGPVTGPVVLTPIQRQFFDWNLEEPQHFNQSVLLAVRPGVPPAVIEQALATLVVHHDALRLRFEPELPDTRDLHGWQQICTSPVDHFELERFDLSPLSETRQAAEIARQAAELQTTLDLAHGPLLRAAFFDLGPERPARLFLVTHHLVVDAVSWRILLEDLQLACSQLIRGEPVALPPKTTSFQHWAQRLQEFSDSKLVENELNQWFTPARMRGCRLPVDIAEGDNTIGSLRTVTCGLDASRTSALLHDVPKAYRTQINDVLLAALAETLGRWTGEQRILIDLEGHGREPLFEDVDLSRTVGWFTSLFPVQLRLRESDSTGETLKSVKEQLRQIPQGGIGYGLLRWLRSDRQFAARLAALPRAELSFNYLGQFDQLLPPDALFTSAEELHGPDRAASQRRSHLVEVVARVAEGRLHVDWHYSSAIHHEQTVQWLAESFISALERIIGHCLSPEAGGFTPSDFPLAGVDERELLKLSELLREIDGDAG
jgi:non-ribosomal peptide synthase protein (TIGR01720 family)